MTCRPSRLQPGQTIGGGRLSRCCASGPPTGHLAWTVSASSSAAVTPTGSPRPFGARGRCCFGTSSPLRSAMCGREADSLEWIHITAAGVDTLLFDELRDSDVVVTNARGVFDRPIAEYVLGAVIAHAKDSRSSFDLQRRHQWQHRETRSITGATALVVGTGGIGREIARLLRAAGLVGSRARAAGPSPTTPTSARSLQSDNLAGRGRLVRSRGPGRAADRRDAGTGRRRGTGGDEARRAPGQHRPRPDGRRVRAARRADRTPDRRRPPSTSSTPSRCPPDHPLWDAPNVTITAHMSGRRGRLARHPGRPVRGNVRRWLAGEPLLNVVDKKLGYIPQERPDDPAVGSNSSTAYRRQDDLAGRGHPGRAGRDRHATTTR